MYLSPSSCLTPHVDALDEAAALELVLDDDETTLLGRVLEDTLEPLVTLEEDAEGAEDALEARLDDTEVL